MKNLKLTALLIIILITKSTVFSQDFSTDSTKCFTSVQLKLIVKSIKKGEICDSIVNMQKMQIFSFKEVLKSDEQIIQENNKRVLELTKNINKVNLRLKISKRLTMYGLPIALGGGFIIGALLLN